MTKVLDIVKGFEKASTPEHHKPDKPSFHNMRDVKKADGKNNVSVLDRAERFDSVTEAAFNQSTIYKIDKIGNELFSVKKEEDNDNMDVSSCDDFRSNLYPNPMEFYRICFDQESNGDESNGDESNGDESNEYESIGGEFIEDEWL